MVNACSNDIGVSSKGYLKRAYRIGTRTLIVIDDSLVNLLSIEEDSWLEQKAIENGILMKIHYFNENGRQDTVKSDNDRKEPCKSPNIVAHSNLPHSQSNTTIIVEDQYVNQR
jgi:hypothetical protein